MTAAPGALWNACTGFWRSRVMPVSSKRGRSGKLLRQRLAHPVEQHHELRKDHDLVPAAHDLGEFLHQQVELAALRDGRLEPGQHVGVAAGLAQAREQGEEAEGLLAHGGADVVAEAGEALAADARVLGALHVRERAEQVHLDLRRQLLRHLVLGAAQDERRELLRAGA